MPETISLKAYLGKVEDLLSVGQNDEVVHHCRHILQYFPRNVAAYELLGRAMVQNQRWDEARAIFLRVLSARPDDFDAHAGLCDVYAQKGQSNDAIWHMERAFEQRPSDRALIDRLRELYRRHRNVEQTRIQLTTAAVARQQAKAGFYERALETLRTMLARMPDRLDLRLLLARTLWDNEQRIEAAEVALDILEILPDCIDANAIMTQLWLDEERPSDAQRFLNRLEALDPYLALELVQGQAPPDETFTLDELDYRRYAQREMATNQPDWLEGLDTAEFKDAFGTSAPRTSTLSLADRLRPPSEVVKPAVEEEWPDLFSPTEAAAPPARPAAAPTTGDLFGDMPDEWSAEWAASPAEAMPDNTGSLFGFPDEPVEAIDLPFSIDEPDEELPAEEPQSPASTEEMPPWLQNTAATIKPAGVTTTLQAVKPEGDEVPGWLGENDAAGNNFQQFMDDEESVVIPSKPVDPLAWLRTSGVEIDDAQERARPTMYDDDGDGGMIVDPSADPLSWMRDSGIELEEQAPENLTGAVSGQLEWMNSKPLSDIEVEAAAAEARGETDVDFFTWLEQQQQSNRVNASEITIDDDPLEWLNDDSLLADLDQDDDIPGEVDARRPFDRPGRRAGAFIAQTRKSQYDFLDRDGGSSVPANPELADEAERQEAMADKGDKQGPDWLNNDSSDDDLEWLGSAGPQDSDANAHLADWLNQGLGDDDEADNPPLADFDWVETPEADEAGEIEPDAEPTASVPDWLADLGPGYGRPEQSLRAAAPVEPEAQAALPIEPAEMPDWLSELGPTYAQPEALQTFAPAEPEPEQPPIFAQASVEPTEPHPELIEEPVVFEDEEPEAQPAAPDWITAMDAQTAVSMSTITNEPESSDMPEWMAEFASEENPEIGLEWIEGGAPAASEPVAETSMADEPVAAEVPDWMAGMEPDSIEAQQLAAELENVTAEPLAEAPMDAPIDNRIPEAVASIDWASEIGPEDALGTSPLEWIEGETSEPVAALPSEQPGASSFDWVNDLAGSDEPESELDEWMTTTPSSLSDIAAAEQPPITDFEWLNAAAPAKDTEPMAEQPDTVVQGMDEPDVDFPELPVVAEQEPDASGGFAWPAEPVVAEADVPDWLDELKPAQEQEEAPAVQGEPLFSWLDIGSEQSATPSTEADMPDWLRAVSAQTEAEAEQEAEPASAVEQIDWLSSIDSASEAEAEPMEAVASIEEQPLFVEMPEPEAEAAPIPTQAEAEWIDSQFELPQEAVTVESVVAEHTPAENAPDWLNAMVPGVDLDYAPAEEEVVEPTEEATQQASPTREFDWLLEVVDEETQPAAKSAPEPVAEVPAEPKPKFSFSKLPAWLRKGDATTR